MSDNPGSGKTPKAGGFLGTLKDALAAASRDEAPPPPPVHPKAAPVESHAAAADEPSPVADTVSPASDPPAKPAPLSAAEAARQARGVTSLRLDKNSDFDGTNTTRMVRMPKMSEPPIPEPEEAPARTQLVRGRQPVKRGQFVTDPVVAWLVIVGGPGLGSYRPVFEGNNTIGRSVNNRIPLDFGDEAISSEEQAYLRYDSTDRSFLFVPNLSKANINSLNNTRPTAAVEIKAMDVITMGRTQLVFVPFCGPEFDWSEISDNKG